MKKTYKAVLLAIISVVCVTTVRADSGGNLLIGFTQSGANSSGNDLYYDLGQASALTNKQTWNLSSLLSAQGFTLSQVQWGVLGDYKNGGTASKLTALTWASTGDGSSPLTINGSSAWNAYQTPINSIITTVFDNSLTGAGDSGTCAYNYQNSWYSETVSPSLPTQWVNVGGGLVANVTGTNTPDILWQVVDDNSNPTNIGSLMLNSSGILTFSAPGSGTPPPPKIVSATRTGTTTTIFFTTTNGTFTYTLYYTNSAGLTTSVSNWLASPTTVTGNGMTDSLTDITADLNRFYRIGVH
jgi:hypothetical protein